MDKNELKDALEHFAYAQRAEDLTVGSLLAAIRAPVEPGLGDDYFARVCATADPAQLEATAQAVVHAVLDQSGLLPLPAFSTLPEDQQAIWHEEAVRCFAASLPQAEAAGMAPVLYEELDGTLPLDARDAGEFAQKPWREAYDAAIVDCVEWYRVGRLPAHRAEVMSFGLSFVYPVPVETTIRRFGEQAPSPREGRVWDLHLVHRDGRLMNPRTVARLEYARKLDRAGRSNFREDPTVCSLVEVYRNEDDDGRLVMELAGYAVMTQPQLACYLARITWRYGHDRKPWFEETIEKFHPGRDS